MDDQTHREDPGLVLDTSFLMSTTKFGIKHTGQTMKNGYCTQAELIAKGWSKTLIERRLIRPDKYANCGPGRVANLYLYSSVQEKESDPVVAAAIAKILEHRPARKAAADAVVAARHAAEDEYLRQHPNRPGLIPYLDRETEYTATIGRTGGTKRGNGMLRYSGRCEDTLLILDVCVGEKLVTDHVWLKDWPEHPQGTRVSFRATARYYDESSREKGYGITLDTTSGFKECGENGNTGGSGLEVVAAA